MSGRNKPQNCTYILIMSCSKGKEGVTDTSTMTNHCSQSIPQNFGKHEHQSNADDDDVGFADTGSSSYASLSITLAPSKI